MKYKLSKYTKILKNDESGDIVIFNTYNGQQSYIFDENLKKQIKKLQVCSMEEENIDNRLIIKYCVPENIDESRMVYEKISEKIHSKKTLSLIIFPTLDCNFKCTYCYENKEKGFMDDVTLNNIYTSVMDHFQNNRFEYLKLEWFGGEPILFLRK